MKSVLPKQIVQWFFIAFMGVFLTVASYLPVDAVKIAFQSSRDFGEFALKYNIYAMDANGKNLVKLTKGPASDLNPTWSPDGSQITFSSDRDGDNEIYVMNADGTNPIQLTHDLWEIDFAPDWSSGGTKITFSSYNHVLYADVYVMNADGTDLVNLTQNQDRDDFMGSWHPTPLAVSPQEKLVMLWGRIKQNKVK